MTAEEMDNMFEVLYNNITSNQAPGLNAYEKSVFLTKAQDEIVKNYFNPKSKGNLTQDGFDGNQKRQVDFSMLTTVYNVKNNLNTDVSTATTQVSNDITAVTSSPTEVVSAFGNALYDYHDNSKSISLPERFMMAINENVEVTRDQKKVHLQVVPIKFDEYSRLMSKPYKRPLKYQAWRLINSDSKGKADLVVGPSDSITQYTLRYIRRPLPIIVSNLDGLTIENKGDKLDCELDPILHEEILQRAVELAKASWTSTGQDNLQAFTSVGQRSE